MAIDPSPGTGGFEAFVAEAERQHLRVNRPGEARGNSDEPSPSIVPHLWKWSAIAKLRPRLGERQGVGVPTRMCAAPSGC